MPLAWVVQDVHQGGARHVLPVVHTMHPEPKDLTVRERKPRRESRAARNSFDEQMEQRRRLEAKARREKSEIEVRRELMVG